MNYQNQTGGWISALFCVLMWSLSAVVICLLKSLPLLFFLSISLIVGGLLGLIVENRLAELFNLIENIKTSGLYLFLLGLNFVAYPLAFRLAPASHVDLIMYLWPTTFVVVDSYVQKKKITQRESWGLFLGFCSILCLIIPDLFKNTIKYQYLVGYIIATIGMFGWTLYNVIGKKKNRFKEKGSSIDIFLLGLIFLLFFICFGKFQEVNAWDMLYLAVYGSMVFGLAFPLWQKGISHLSVAVLGGLTNAIPILSVSWLVLCNLSPFSIHLCIAFLLLVLGCLLICIKKDFPSQVKALDRDLSK